MAYLSSRVVLLTFLYFIQGLPYGLQARFLPVYLRTKGHSLTSLGLFKMLLAPWLCKALWAPFVDKYSTKQKWLLWSIFGLMVTCAVTSVIPPDNIVLLCLSIFSLNLFAATQDIAVDSIALTILPPDELGKGNTAQVVGYKIGAIFGGGILVWFMDILGWTGLFVALTLLYIEALLFVYLSPTLRVLKRLGIPKTENFIDSKMCQEKNEVATESDSIPNKSNFEKVSLENGESNIVDSIVPLKETDASSYQQHPKEDVSELIKSALEFIETKDELERRLELRHELKAEELGAEKQREVVQEIVAACSLMKPEQGEVAPQGETSSETDIDVQPLDNANIPNGEKIKTHEQVTLAKDLAKDGLQIETSAQEVDDSLEAEAPPGDETSGDTGEGGAAVEELGYMEESEHDSDVDDSTADIDIEDSECPTPGSQNGDEAEEEDLEVSVRESEDDDSFTCSAVRVSGRFAFLWDVVTAPNTGWIMIYVLIYKLGEQGALGMLPLFLIDQEVKAVDVTFWTGVIGQATSMLGSCLGGWILSHPVYRLPSRLLIYQLSLCRLLPLGLLLWVVMLWSGGVFSSTILYRAAIIAMNLLLIVSGMVTTATFTLMMECSQQAPRSAQATHYTLLSSLEVFGKLTFMSICGALVDYFGYVTMYLSFVVLSAMLLPWLWRYPDILCEKKDS